MSSRPRGDDIGVEESEDDSVGLPRPPLALLGGFLSALFRGCRCVLFFLGFLGTIVLDLLSKLSFILSLARYFALLSPLKLLPCTTKSVSITAALRW